MSSSPPSHAGNGLGPRSSRSNTVWIALGALIVIAFVGVLLSAPTTSSPNGAAAKPPSTSAASNSAATSGTTPLFRESTSDGSSTTSKYPDCSEGSVADGATTCQSGDRTLTVARGRVPVVIAPLGVQVRKVSVGPRLESGARVVTLSVRAATQQGAKRIEPAQFYLAFANRRYPLRTIRPERPVPHQVARTFRLNFTVGADGASQLKDPSRRVRLIFSRFGQSAASAKRAGVIVLKPTSSTGE